MDRVPSEVIVLAMLVLAVLLAGAIGGATCVEGQLIWQWGERSLEMGAIAGFFFLLSYLTGRGRG